MKMTKFVHIFWMSAIAIVMSACVPKATEKKAACGVNQAFNSVSRSCYSIAEIRTRPTGTKSSDTISQEVAKTITLSYSDNNNDQALTCKISGISANIEVVSPLVVNGAIFTKADLVYSAAQSTANALPLGADRTTALLEVTAMQTALANAKVSFTYSNILNQIGIFKTSTNNILSIATIYNSTYSAVKYYYDLTQTRMIDFNAAKGFVDNRCDCSGGVCTTVVAPRIQQNGTAGFSYSITDVDGEGDAKIVSLSIAAAPVTTNYFKPSVESNYLTFSESATNIATAYSFTLPVARDYLGTSTFSYAFNGTINGSNYGVTTLGLVSNCMNLVGSSGPTDTSCTYTPNSGDAYDTAVPAKATVTIDDLVFTAKKEGAFANNYSIQYFDLKYDNTATDAYVTKSESYGLVSQTYPDTFVRVVGNKIQVYLVKGITTSSDIKDLINSDQKSKSLVTVTGGSLSTFPDPFVSTPSAISLAGGSDAFDTISYTASNGYASSINTANVMVKITPTEDAPIYNLVASTSVTVLEDSGPIVIDLSPTYTDAENNADACDVDPLDATFLANFTVNSCTCVANVCTLSVSANANVSSTSAYTLHYRVGSLGQYAAYRAYSINITPVNDAPTMSAVGVQTILENSTAAPSSGFVDVVVGPGGGGFESSQVLTMSLSGSNTTLIPNSSCQNYTPGAGTPVGAVTPTGSGFYYFDTTNNNCYVSTGATNTSWALYPSLTAFPKCIYESWGLGAPGAGVIPSASGKYYLDTTNNKCYRSTAATSGSWVADTTLTDYYISYVPVANQSGSTIVSMSLSDNGGTTNAGVDTLLQTFTLNVTSVDDPPYFLSTINQADTNEGGQVVAGPFKVDEDQGSSADEDAQAMTVSSITSDNTSVLPTTAISIFYDLNDNGVEDTGEARAVGATLEAAAGNDVKLHAFYLKINPIAGVSGNSNIVLTINDGNGLASHFVTTTFSLIVHPVAALHGGWANISAKGIKTDKNGAPAADADVQCNYNKSTDLKACDTNQNCTGTSSPNAVIIPDEAGVLYWDSANKKCYRSLAADKFSWVDFKTSCPVTRQSGICSSENCINSSAPTPTAVGQYYYNTLSNTCFISTGTAAGNWIAYTPSRVTLAWNSFTVTGSGSDSGVQVYGWNVYRREAGYDYDFKSGFLKTNSTDTMTISDATVKTFTDTTAVAGKVYYYLVRPVDSTTRHLTISTPDVFSEVRILAPIENLAFVHRWMVNQEICNSMHMTTTTTNKVDPTHNYRCPYEGPGEIIDTGVHYYDINKDMLVDISENGCPYTAAPACTANGCVGIGDPTTLGVTGMVANDVYYDRSAGSCYIYDGAAWGSYNSAGAALIAAASTKVNTALNAPLVNISQSQASVVCTNRSSAAATANLTGVISTPLLPTKKEYIAYSAAPIGMTDTTITDMEQGFSLNVQSRCNSTNANGLETAYTDSSIPSTSFIYSLPGTASSAIKSLYTGSVPWVNDFSTETCSSRYGVQDVYGNVAEWVKDKMTCNGAPSTYVCTSDAGTDMGTYDFGAGNIYGFDLITGPYNDASGDSTTAGADAFLTNWAFRDELFTAGKFNFPIGMPFNVNIGLSVVSTSPAIPYLLDIGPTAGITTNQLHEDGILVNGASVNAIATNPTQKGSYAQGGSYLSGNVAGRYSSELVPDAVVRPDIGFRCYIPIDKTNFPADPGRHTYSY